MNITTRPLSNDELRLLLMRSRSPWKQIYYIAVYTGLRISDLIRLPWTPEPDYRPIIEMKTKKPKLIMWTDSARGIWLNLYSYGKPRKYLFPLGDISSYRKHLQRDCILLGIDGYRISFHSLRKTHATIIFKNFGIIQAKKSLNHSDMRTTESYLDTALSFQNLTVFDQFIAGSQSEGDQNV